MYELISLCEIWQYVICNLKDSNVVALMVTTMVMMITIRWCLLYADENPVPAAVDAERATESGGGGGGGGGGGEARSIRRRRKRSISLERNVETLVVVDKNMMEYHRNENIENYVLTIMNMV